MIVPTSYRGILRLAKKHGVTLTPLSFPIDYPKSCYISLLAIANGAPIGKRAKFGYAKMREQLTSSPYWEKTRAIEAGFESYSPNSHNPRYYAIGKRLRETYVEE